MKFLWHQCSNNCCQKSSSNSECQFYLNDVKLLLASVEVILIWNCLLKVDSFFPSHESRVSFLRNIKRASLFRARLTCPWGRGSKLNCLHLALSGNCVFALTFLERENISKLRLTYSFTIGLFELLNWIKLSLSMSQSLVS